MPKSITARPIESLAASVTPTTLSETSTTITTAPADDVPRVRSQRLPEDREVVRDEERRRRDRDDVDEHLRPGRTEGDELVEAVSREARRAAGLGKADGSLGIRRGGRREDDPRDDEDERRQPEGEDGGEAEGVVDRRADVAVRRREERRRAEHPLHPHLAPPSAPWHARESTPGRGRPAVIRRHGGNAQLKNAARAPNVVSYGFARGPRASTSGERAATRRSRPCPS